MNSTQLIEIYPKTTFPGTYATSCLKRWGSFSLSKNDQEEAAQSAGDTKSSYDPKKCDGKTGRMGRTGQWIYHQMVEEPEARCTSENLPANHHEQEKEVGEYHSIPVSGCDGLPSHRISGSRLCHHH